VKRRYRVLEFWQVETHHAPINSGQRVFFQLTAY
jgi:hypothetical protein